MILKIKKDEFNWLYIETKCFEIYSTYDEIPPNNEDFGPIAHSYAEAEERKLITIERVGNSTTTPPLKTFINTENTTILCIGDFTGFALNNKGQTVERL